MKENYNNPSELRLLTTTYEVRTKRHEYVITVNSERVTITVAVFEIIDEHRGYPFADPDNLRHTGTYTVVMSDDSYFNYKPQYFNTTAEAMKIIKELNQTNKEI